MVKLKYTGPGKQRIPGVGDFITGTVHEAPEAIANQFRGLKGWTILDEKKNPALKPERARVHKQTPASVLGPGKKRRM